VSVEFRAGCVLIEVDGQVRELPNDFVWILAGGTPPSDFLKAAGVAFGATATTENLATK
jgi:thioredoxin reductase